MPTPLVAIRTLVYNHESFLRDYFEGIMMQKTNFPFIAVVHDDCSRDNSAMVIREFAEKYPDIIKPIFEEVNCYQSGQWDVAEQKMKTAYGGAKYIAFCEGDDYWTDPHKLQRQVDFLEKNPDYSAISENGITKNSVINKEYLFNEAPSHDVSLEEIIIQRRFPTAGVVCRAEALSGFNEATKLHIDTILWCWLLTKGRFRYEQIVSSVYRKGEQGITVNIHPYTFAKIAESWQKEILRIFDVNKHFIYHNIALNYLNCAKSALRKLFIRDSILCVIYSTWFYIKSVFA